MHSGAHELRSQQFKIHSLQVYGGGIQIPLKFDINLSLSHNGLTVWWKTWIMNMHYIVLITLFFFFFLSSNNQSHGERNYHITIGLLFWTIQISVEIIWVCGSSTSIISATTPNHKSIVQRKKNQSFSTNKPSIPLPRQKKHDWKLSERSGLSQISINKGFFSICETYRASEDE